MNKNAILFLLLYLCSSCGLKWEHDNFLEEHLEDVLQNKTGIDIDFTPSSEESKL